jgi:hypothetical protein
VVITTLSTFNGLMKKGGIKFLVIYLKACTSLLQQAIGGQRLTDLTPFGCRVARSRSGLPRIIPALHRARIRKGEVWVIRFWMTIFGLYRVLAFPGKVKLSTITAPSTFDSSLLYVFSQFVVLVFWPTVKRCFPVTGSITDALWSEEGEGPIQFMRRLAARPFLISKTGPATNPGVSSANAQSTSPASILGSAFTWLSHPLYPTLKSWCEMTGNIWVLNKMKEWGAELWVEEDDRTGVYEKTSLFSYSRWLGKLGFKEEPAGKVRVFAMVDPWTQWIMEALASAIFKLLRKIPQDGTFDQGAPIHRLREWQKGNRLTNGSLPALFSFDLSAATDRIPIVLQKVLLSPILTAWGAELWASLLVAREYQCPTTIRFGKKGKPQSLSPTGSVMYSTGQPMGALSSWAMLALIHHAIVQWAALRAGVITVGQWFGGYAILGDDLVVGSVSVAREYSGIMASLGVEIGGHKSLESRNGRAMEFAKRTFLDGEDVSMVPFAEFVMGRQSLAGLLELVRKYHLTFGQTLSVLGYGYRAKANASKRLFSMPKRLRNYILTFYGPGGPGYMGLRGWLPMKSITSSYKSVETRVSSLVTQFFDKEMVLIQQYLESLSPLLAKAKELGTVSRDREHYGTTPRGPDRTSRHLGLLSETPSQVVDSLNEAVYREAFLDSVIAVRDLRTRLEETSVPLLTWEGLESLWAMLREIETQLGALPFPRNIQTRVVGEKSLSAESKVLARWYRHSSTFRSTVT